LKSITKKFGPYPASHRQPNHEGHCRLIHGHNFYFDVTFSAVQLDKCGFVYDFGQCKEIKEELAFYFDHTFLLNESDPEKIKIMDFLHSIGLNNVRLFPNVSAEALAQWVQMKAEAIVDVRTEHRVSITRVVCWEDEKNSATYDA
jgi:6-pyruvoyltetrahydropterin/6-carboxytetrahydropterin synthase